MTIELVMLDCDGVLIDSEIIAAKVECERLNAWGFDIEPGAFSERFSGASEEDIGREVERETGRSLPEGFHEATREAIYKRVSEEVAIIDGADAMIRALDRPLCVCSNSGSAYLRTALERVGLWETLGEHVFSARDLGPDRQKPRPDVFLYAAEAMGVDPRRAVVLEDSAHGVEAGVAAGARAIDFTGGAHSWRGHSDALTDAGATTVVSRHADVPATVAALAGWDERTA